MYGSVSFNLLSGQRQWLGTARVGLVRTERSPLLDVLRRPAANRQDGCKEEGGNQEGSKRVLEVLG